MEGDRGLGALLSPADRFGETYENPKENQINTSNAQKYTRQGPNY